jgi:hypothetical protein
MAEDVVEALLDDADGLLEVEGVDGDVADIGDAQGLEGGGPRRHVVGPQHARFGADLARPVAGAGAVRGADVHGHADEAGIEAFAEPLRQLGQPHHRRRPGEARHLVAAERLVVGQPGGQRSHDGEADIGDEHRPAGDGEHRHGGRDAGDAAGHQEGKACAGRHALPISPETSGSAA